MHMRISISRSVTVACVQIKPRHNRLCWLIRGGQFPTPWGEFLQRPPATSGCRRTWTPPGVDPADELLAVAEQGGRGFKRPFDQFAHFRGDLLIHPLEAPRGHLRRGIHTADERRDVRAMHEGIDPLAVSASCPMSCGIGSCRITVRAWVTFWVTACIVVGAVGTSGILPSPTSFTAVSGKDR